MIALATALAMLLLNRIERGARSPLARAPLLSELGFARHDARAWRATLAGVEVLAASRDGHDASHAKLTLRATSQHRQLTLTRRPLPGADFTTHFTLHHPLSPFIALSPAARHAIMQLTQRRLRGARCLDFAISPCGELRLELEAQLALLGAEELLALCRDLASLVRQLDAAPRRLTHETLLALIAREDEPRHIEQLILAHLTRSSKPAADALLDALLEATPSPAPELHLPASLRPDDAALYQLLASTRSPTVRALATARLLATHDALRLIADEELTLTLRLSALERQLDTDDLAARPQLEDALQGWLAQSAASERRQIAARLTLRGVALPPERA